MLQKERLSDHGTNATGQGYPNYRSHQVGDESEELHDCGEHDRLSERSQACT
jgi:hypothetical protein